MLAYAELSHVIFQRCFETSWGCYWSGFTFLQFFEQVTTQIILQILTRKLFRLVKFHPFLFTKSCQILHSLYKIFN